MLGRRKQLLLISILIPVAVVLSALALILSRHGKQIMYAPSPNITSCLCEASSGYASTETPYYLGELDGKFYSCVDSTLFSSELSMCFHVHQLEGEGIDSIEDLSLKNVNSGEIVTIPADSDQLTLHLSENRELILLQTTVDSSDESFIDIQGDISITYAPRAELTALGLLFNFFRTLPPQNKFKKEFHLTTQTTASSSILSACICSTLERNEDARNNLQINSFRCIEKNVLSTGVPSSICLELHDTKNYQIKSLLSFDVIHLMTGGIIQSVDYGFEEVENM